MLIQDSCLLRKEALIWHVCYIYNTQNIHVNKHTIYTDFFASLSSRWFSAIDNTKKIKGTYFKLQAMYFEIHALYFLLNALYGFDWRKNILKSRNKWIYATDVTSFIAYTFTKNSIVHNSTLEKELFLFVLFYGENVFLRYLRVRCFFVQTAIRVHTTTFIIIL